MKTDYSAQYDDIILTFFHPHGEIEITLQEWMRVGPGQRPLLSPMLARSKSMGLPLPLNVVPLRYRNNIVSRFLIFVGIMRNPWKLD